MDVNIKHAGKTLAVVLDVEQPPSAFKNAVYQATGVPVERMKIMVKGGVLKVNTGDEHADLLLMAMARTTRIGRKSGPSRARRSWSSVLRESYQSRQKSL